MAAAEQVSPQLRSGAIGVWDVVFQSITYMAPGTGLVFAIGVGIPFVGNALPLAVIVRPGRVHAGRRGDRPDGEVHPVRRWHLHVCGEGPQPELRVLRRLAVPRLRHLPAAVFLFTLNGYLIDSTLKDQGWSGGSWSGWWIWTDHHDRRRLLPDLLRRPSIGQGRHHSRRDRDRVFVALSLWTILGEKACPQPVRSVQPVHVQHRHLHGRHLGILAFIGFEASSALGEEARTRATPCRAASSTPASASASTTCSARTPGRRRQARHRQALQRQRLQLLGAVRQGVLGDRPGSWCSSP